MTSPIFYDERLKRLYYQSLHRGCKETDFILGRFADQHLAQLTPEQLDLYENFLNQDDWDIYNWIIGKHPVPDAFDHDLFRLIQDQVS